MFSKVVTVLLLHFILSFSILSGQDCHIQIDGYVYDLLNNEPLTEVNIFIQERNKGIGTDSNGYFILKNLCPDEYHLNISHIGCTAQQHFIHLIKDTMIIISMDHSASVIDGIVISGHAMAGKTQNSQSISQQKIADNANNNLANLLVNLTGVSSLKNGSGIAKPVVQGLYGNRLTILNNGIAQSGQQWGNDHSPEIDPMVANKITVVKSVSALAYPGTNLGSAILIEPSKIGTEPHLHGTASYYYESNGRGHGTNLQLQKYTPAIAWKINGTFKKSGDKSTKNYFLNNTGSQETNFALQLEKTWSSKWFSDLYFSTFNTELGVLRGSHIGNVTDLQEAYTRDVPFYTEDQFSYAIDAPKQKVNHHLAKLHSRLYLNDANWLDFIVSGQLNIRKEFDVRRSNYAEKPALSLRQYNYYLETKYHKDFSNDLEFNCGIQSNITDNTNEAETGILPLIPDYRSFEFSGFAILNKKINKWFIEGGFRYDQIYQNAVTISSTLPRKIIRYHNVFHNISSSLGASYLLSKDISFTHNIGLANRNPAINELYSAGLHQGVSGIEEGNMNLKSEKSIKNTFSINAKIEKALTIESLFYHQWIHNYIYLRPSEEARLTIRGAFPVFNYQQTNAQIFGWDFSSHLKVSNSLNATLGYSWIKGLELKNKLSLINIPSNVLNAVLQYEVSKTLTFKRLKFENIKFEINTRYVFKQNNILESQDFVLPPAAYQLFGIRYSTNLQIFKSRFRLYSNIENLFNTSYRDYLNRLRYFANDLGRNIVVGMSINL